MNLLLTFIVLNIVNVILQTAKSIATVKCGKTIAAFANAIAYGLYTIVIIYTVCELPLWEKVLIVALANFIGVYVVKIVEQKLVKEKLWKIEMTVPTKYRAAVDFDLRQVPHSYIEISDKHTLFNFYCATQAESKKVKDIVAQYGAKYFVSETKNL